MWLAMRGPLSSGDLEPLSSLHTSMRQRAQRCRLLRMPRMRNGTSCRETGIYRYRGKQKSLMYAIRRRQASILSRGKQ